jgi:hypothetical protein
MCLCLIQINQRPLCSCTEDDSCREKRSSISFGSDVCRRLKATESAFDETQETHLKKKEGVMNCLPVFRFLSPVPCYADSRHVAAGTSGKAA